MAEPSNGASLYARAIKGVADVLRESLAGKLRSVDYSKPVDQVRDELIGILRPYARMSAESASELAAQFYEETRAQAVGGTFSARSGDYGYSDAAVDRFVRDSVQHLVDDGEDGAASVESDVLRYLGEQATRSAGETMGANAKRDRERVRFARVPTGTDSYEEGCPFCRMLASRGFVYGTAADAGAYEHYHDGCSCVVVPGFGRHPSIAGYDPAAYKDGYEAFKRYDHSKAIENSRKRRNKKHD